MPYKQITHRLLALIESSNIAVKELNILKHNIPRPRWEKEAYELSQRWVFSVKIQLQFEGMMIEYYKVENFERDFPPAIRSGFNDHVTILGIIRDICTYLISVSQKIEERHDSKRITLITIDDLDQFKIVYDMAAPVIDEKYSKSAFLEDDVENCFLEILKEPYKENDSGSETRDLHTSRLIVKGQRKHAVFLLKGRGVKTSMRISNCGTNGDQLLKLAKNSYAEVFIIQHVNKIETEVLEALQDHILSHSKANDIYICAIDGEDTARILSGLGRDLEELASKKGAQK